MELTTKNWKEFRIEDLFDYERGKEAAPNQNQHGECPLISGTQDNNGFVRLVEPTKVIDGHCLTVSVNFASTVFYQEENFCASVNIIILRPKSEMTKKQLLFIGSILSKKHKVYSYTDKVSKVLLMKETLLLPSKNDEPDWDFMEEFIKEIEEKYILNVDNYNQENIDKALSVTGLTTADLNGNLEVKPADRYEEFRVGDLFDAFLGIVTPNEMLLKKGKFPVITGVTENNGINGYFNEFIANYTYSNMITVSNRGVYSGTAYYHNYEFILGSNVIALKPLSFKMTKNIALFIMTLINKLHYGGYDNYPTKSSILEDAILLPAIDENTPDFDYMEKAIYIYILKRLLSLGKWITKKKSEL